MSKMYWSTQFCNKITRITNKTDKSIAFAAIIAALSVLASPAQAQDGITITVIPALAPNAYGSPNWNAWVSNATTAIQNGYTSYGDPSSPSFYQRAPNIIPVTNDIVTGFPSWDGLADPGAIFGAAYSQELGNRLQFGIDIKGGTNLISISQLSFTAQSTDPGNTLGFTFAEGSYSYSSSYIGIIYGAGGNNTYITNGDPTQLVNEIVGRGSGNAWDTYDTSGDIASEQSNIVYAASQIGTQPFTFSGTYSIAGATGAAAVMMNPGSLVQGQGGTTITVIPALAPNAYGSPNWNAWVSNATTAIQNGYTSYGDPTSPSFYQRAPGVIPVTNDIVTGFPSWDGLADPGTIFGAAYSQELGNRLQFGIDIKGGTNLISISQLSFTAQSSDPGNTLGFTFAEGSYSYSSSYIGIIYGAGGNNTYITNGDPTQLVNEIVGRGSGNAWDVYDTSGDIASEQSNIVYNVSQISAQPFTFSGTYSIAGATGAASVMMNPGSLVQGQGGTTISVIPALAPNAYGSPNWNAWVSNATTAIQNGYTSYGDPSSPSFYQQAPAVISVTNDIVTGFPSWDGLADPGTVFGAAYSQEYGNRLQFGIDIKGGTNLISLSQLSFAAQSTDPGNTLGFTFPEGSYSYSASYIGIIYGTDGNNTYITNGPSTQLVNEIVGRGSGNAWDTYDTSGNIASEQSNIVYAASQIGTQPFSFTGTYSIAGATGTATLIMNPYSLTSVVAPNLTITMADPNNVSVAWAGFAGGFTLQTNSDIGTPNWGNYSGPITANSGTNSATIPITAGSLFFRLSQ